MARLAGSLALGLLAAVGAAWAQDADRLYDQAEQAFSEARYDDALADYSASHRAARGERRVTVAEIIGLRGSDLAKRVDLFTAERFLERSIELLAEGPAVSRAELLILLGNVQETLGHAERAANSIDAAMVLSQPFEGTAQCETWLRAQLAHGGHRLRRRAYSDVEQDADRIRASRCDGPLTQAYQLRAAILLGAAYRQQGSFAAAEQAYREAERVVEERLTDDTVSTNARAALVAVRAEVNRVLGELYLYSGSTLEQALDHLEQALTMHTELDDPLLAAIARGHLAEAKHFQGRYVEAIEDYRALRAFFDAFGYADGAARMAYHEGRAVSAATSRQLRALAEPIGDAYAAAMQNFDLAIARYTALDDPEWVWRAYFARAVQEEQIGAPLAEIERTYAAAIDTFETIGDSLAGGDQYKDQFGDSYRRLYERRIALELQKAEPNRALVDSLTRRSRSRAIRQNMLASMTDGECRDFVAALAKTQRDEWPIASDVAPEAPPAGTVVVQYHPTGHGIVATVFAAGKEAQQRACEGDCLDETQLRTRVARLAAELRKVEALGGSTVLEDLFALYGTLIAPIEDLLTGDTLRIRSTGLVELVPFAALAKPGGDGRPVYLMESQALEVEAIAGARPSERLETAPAAPSIGWVVAPRTYNPELEREPPEDRALASALDLARSMSARYPDSAIYAGPEATKENLKTSLSRFDIVHIGAHARLAPGEQFIQLAPGRQPGQLRPCEILQNPDVVKARLVVLAACSSIVSAASAASAEELTLASLGSAFSALGVPNVIGTLWDVSAEGTSRALMTAFYDNLQLSSLGHALAEAQRSMVASGGQYAHPYYWSGFMLLVSASN